MGKNSDISKIIPPVLWLILIWVFSSIPAKNLPSVKIIGVDKLVHIGEYLVLALLVNLKLKDLNTKNSTVLFTYLALTLSAALDEWHQNLITNRSCTTWDFLANLAGLSIGFCCYWKRSDRSNKSIS